MQRIIILHTNDIHGHLENLARIATLVEKIRESNSNQPVLFMDAGDSQDRGNDLSKKTKGVAMHRLLRIAGCQASVPGNKCMRRYGMGILQKYAQVLQAPLLLSNLFLPDGSPIPGTQPCTTFMLGNIQIGVIGVSTDTSRYVSHHHLQTKPAASVIRKQAKKLRDDGAQIIVVLSHMGLWVDREIARKLQDDIDLIVGGHSHTLLPTGEKIGRVYLAHAGDYGRFLGCIELLWDNGEFSVNDIHTTRVPYSMPQAPGILAEIEAIRSEIK